MKNGLAAVALKKRSSITFGESFGKAPKDGGAF